MEISGNIRKMEVSQGEHVGYQLPLGSRKLSMNQIIGSPITMTYQGSINCVRCGRSTNKSFAQGFCYPCFSTAPETEECVLRPEGTLYPLLTRQKNAGLLQYRWEESTQGPPRKYYALTEIGKVYLKELDTSWNTLIKSVESIKNYK